MTKKHFELTADILNSNMPQPDYGDETYGRRRFAWLILCGDFCREFRMLNPRFDRDTFLIRCGFTEDERR